VWGGKIAWVGWVTSALAVPAVGAFGQLDHVDFPAVGRATGPELSGAANVDRRFDDGGEGGHELVGARDSDCRFSLVVHTYRLAFEHGTPCKIPRLVNHATYIYP